MDRGNDVLQICLRKLLGEPGHVLGFPGGASGKEPACQCRRHKRHGFDPWIRKIRWRKAWQATPVFLLGKSHGQRSLVGYSPWGPKKSQTGLKRLSMHSCKHGHVLQFDCDHGFPRVCICQNSLNCINFQSGKERVKEERGVGSWESVISPGKFRDLFPWVGRGWTECQITIVRGREIISALKDHSTVISPNPCEPCTHLSCLEGFPLSSHVYLFF